MTVAEKIKSAKDTIDTFVEFMCVANIMPQNLINQIKEALFDEILERYDCWRSSF